MSRPGRPRGGPADVGLVDRDDLAARVDMRRRLIGRIERSTEDRRLAEFVVNRLTVHETDLLAEAAVVFARDKVEALIEDADEADRGGPWLTPP